VRGAWARSRVTVCRERGGDGSLVSTLLKIEISDPVGYSEAIVMRREGQNVS